MNPRSFQFFGGLVREVATVDKVVALTFDDGPTARTDEVLAVLDGAGIKATFFLNGLYIDDMPDPARRLAAAGHELSNHWYTHSRLVLQRPAFIRAEIEPDRRRAGSAHGDHARD